MKNIIDNAAADVIDFAPDSYYVCEFVYGYDTALGSEMSQYLQENEAKKGWQGHHGPFKTVQQAEKYGKKLPVPEEV